MRHLRSILYALVLAPSVWVLIGVGFTDDLSSRGREFFSAESISGLLLVVFAGILVTILAFSPISPAGPALTGAGFLGVTIWAFNSPTEYAALWAPEVAKDGFDLSRPAYGLAALLSIPLLCTALSARRWARYEPPVLPIIGEIGRFRGAAKAPGIPVAVEQTTIIRTPGPVVPAADRTVALNSAPAADRTVAINSGTPAADRTVAIGKPTPVIPAPTPAVPAATPVIPARTPVIPSSTPAADRTVALPSIERATTLSPAPAKPPALPAAP
ncbi:MAG TPA: hypothetical protein VN408_02785, partial [Actinoplanes sp.]|nr:hypothetical protein [Actinoplanes sp.]